MAVFERIESKASSPDWLARSIPREIADQIHDSTKSLEGWCTLDKAFHLAGLVLANQCRTVVEIGTYGGRSLVPMAHALQYLGGGVAIGIEPFRNDIAVETPTDELAPFVRLIELSSDEAYAAFRSRTESVRIDLLHIDGSHSPVQSMRDVTNWSTLLSDQGTIVLDDITWDSTQDARRFLLDHFSVVDEIVGTDGEEGYGVYRRRKPQFNLAGSE